MERFLAVLVALLVLSGSAIAVVGGQSGDAGPADRAPVAGVSDETPRVLALDRAEAAGFGRPDLSVTTALAAETSTLESTLFRYEVETEVEQVETDTEKRKVLLAATRAVERRVDSVETEERSARMQYIQGEESASAYLESLGRIDVAARGWDRTLERIEVLSDRRSVVRSAARSIGADLETLKGPNRERAGEIVLGQRASDRMYVEASEQGTILADIEDGAYVREAVRTDNSDDDAGAMTIGEAESRFEELYPVAWETRSGISVDKQGPDVWRLELRHDHGTLTSYLDTSTRYAYREVHLKTLSGIPTVTETTVDAGNTTLNVSRTYAGGPLEISVANATGEPVFATVSVDGTRIGVTGQDGSIWAVSPPGTYNVTAERNGQEIEATVTAR